MISVDMVIDRIAFYYEGGSLVYDDFVEPAPLAVEKTVEDATPKSTQAVTATAAAPVIAPPDEQPKQV
jgi:hypothetical protein